jgi:hypothetical protein
MRCFLLPSFSPESYGDRADPKPFFPWRQQWMGGGGGEEEWGGEATQGRWGSCGLSDNQSTIIQAMGCTMHKPK